VAYTVEFLKTAEEELAKLPKEAQRQIIKRSRSYGTTHDRPLLSS